MDRYKEGYNQANRDWEKKIQKKIQDFKNYKLTDGVDEFGIHSMNWLVADYTQSVLENLLKKG